MSALSFRNIDRLFATLHESLPPTPHRTTGQPGLFRVIPAGWAEVTVWPLPGADEFGAECDHYTGPILHDTEKVIGLDINGTEYTWLKSDRITIKYGTGDAA